MTPPSNDSSQSTITPSSSKKCSRYSETTKYGRKDNKKQKKDELMELANETMRKYCASEDTRANNVNNLKNLSDCDIAGMKYGRDLASLDEEQRNFVEKIVADTVFFAKQKKLTQNSSVQLSTMDAPQQRNNNNYPMPNYVQLSPWTANSNFQDGSIEVRNENVNAMSEFLTFKPTP